MKEFDEVKSLLFSFSLVFTLAKLLFVNQIEFTCQSIRYFEECYGNERKRYRRGYNNDSVQILYLSVLQLQLAYYRRAS
jgi:hypothetical protein